MKLGIVGLERYIPLGVPGVNGRSEYIFNLAENLRKKCKHDNCYFYFNILWKSIRKTVLHEPQLDSKGHKIRFTSIPKTFLFSNRALLISLYNRLLYRITLPLYLKNDGIDILLNTSYHFPSFYGRKILLLDCSLPDEIFKYEKVIKEADLIITFSKIHKRFIMDMYAIKSERIKLFAGIDNDFIHHCLTYKGGSSNILSRFGINKRFILSIEEPDCPINLSYLIRTFYLCNERLNSDLQLVIIGKLDWRKIETASLLKHLGLDKEIIFIDSVSKDELAVIYKKAEILLYPAFVEKPTPVIFETMAAGLPTITFKNKLTEEFLGDVGIFVENFESTELVDRILPILNDEKIKEELSLKAITRFKTLMNEYIDLNPEEINNILEMKRHNAMESKEMQFYDGRTIEQVRNHYEVEKAIATRLKKAIRGERKIIYQTMYDEFFKQIPDHPRLKRRQHPIMTAFINRQKMKLIENFINKSTIFVEFGPGDCRFGMDVSNRVRFIYGVDISDQREKFDNVPDNFELIIYNGYDLEMQENSVDVVFSDQLIEHLHPEDIELHFQLVKKILKPRGVYIFRTPHRFSGPHDISRYFSDKAEGFHLKEWTYSEMIKILKYLKYSSWSGYRYEEGNLVQKPSLHFIIIEYIFNILPKRLRRKITSKYLSSSITMTAIK